MIKNNNIKRNYLALALLMPALLLVLILWLPFGFKLIGLIEEWSFLKTYYQYGTYFLQSFQGPLAMNLLRPLMVVPLSLAYILDPNSFNYWNILLILSLMLSSISLAYLIWKATDSLALATLAAIFVGLYPAETMQFSLRILHISWSFALALLATACFIAAYDRSRSVYSYGLASVAFVALLTSILIYEASFALIFLPFFIFYIRDGFNISIRKLKSHIWLILFWLAAISCFLAYLVYAIFINPDIIRYQNALTGGKGLFTSLIASFPKLFTIGMLHALIGGWFEAIRVTFKEYSWLGHLYITISTVILSTIFLFSVKKDIPLSEIISNKKLFLKRLLRLSIIGLLLIGCGYAPTLASNHTMISQRTFLFATPGAIMVWLALIACVAYWKKWLAKILVISLIFIGVGAQLYQFNYYIKLSEIQRNLLRNIVENFNGDLKNKTLLILDNSNQLDKLWIMYAGNLQNALIYFYQKPVEAIKLCYLPGHEWRQIDNLSRTGLCIEGENAWRFRTAKFIPGQVLKKPTDITIAKKDIITLVVNADGSVSRKPILDNYRKHLQYDNNVTSLRYRNILLPKRSYLSAEQFWRVYPEQYRWGDDYVWNLDTPIRGSGWRETDWEVNYFFHKPSTWKTQKTASLLFNLNPIDKPYLFRSKFGIVLNKAIHDSIQIRINQTPLLLHWINDVEVNAVISEKILLNGINKIEFISKIDPNYYDLSLTLEKFEIVPSEKG